MMDNQGTAVEKWTLTAAILASSMVFIDFSTLNVALPAIQKELNINGKNLLWIINAYTLFLSSLLLLGGSLGDIYGRKKIFVIGIIIFSISSFLCGVSGGIEMLIIARGFQGVGGALMVPGSLSIISSVIPSKRRGKAYGTWSTFSALTTSAGPVFGGWLAGIGLWRVIFYINLPIAVFSIIALVAKVPESKDESAKKLDLPGAVFATAGLAGITYGFLEASDTSFAGLKVIISLAAGVLSLIIFMIIEIKSSHPLMPLNLFKSRTFSGVNLLTLLMYTALSVGLFFLPLNLVQIQGYREVSAGLAILPFAILISAMSRFSGIFADKFGARIPLIAGPLVAGLGIFLLTFPGVTNGPSEYWATFFPGILFLGIGMGIVVAPLTAAVMSSVPSGNTGIASGINNTMARIAGLVAIAVLGSFIIISFRNNLESRAADLTLTHTQRSELIENSNNLAETKPPDGLTKEESARIISDIKHSFVSAFDLILYLSAALALLSALTAFLTVEKGILKE
jgi:EmrB/QacA subfamily drug resistance transporter